MTRITNFGRKRTYIEAGFAQTPVAQNDINEINNSNATGPAVENEAPTESIASPKKKRKRTKMSKRDGNAAKDATTAPNVDTQEDVKGTVDDATKPVAIESSTGSSKPNSKKVKVKKKGRNQEKTRNNDAETRRLKRQKVKLAATTCFSCREMGHAAKDCPKMNKDDDTSERGKIKNVIGICYRCGSSRHTLSKCKKAVNQENPLPFASCFVCNSKGHLASSCPQNKSKGIYPNGGCCKLCGDTTHLARDCGLRKKADNIDTPFVMGSGQLTGADEDDFHTFKRRKSEVERGELRESKAKLLMDLKVGAHSGSMKALGTEQKSGTKKVVYF